MAEEPSDILNVSYDVSRELYADIDKAFVAKYKAETGKDITINQSRSGRSSGGRSHVQSGDRYPGSARSADLVTADRQSRFPNNSVPYYSLPAFLVRKGNPKSVTDWSDLVRDDVKVVFPNPKTSGNGRYTYLAAYAYALEANKGDQEKAKEFVAQAVRQCACVRHWRPCGDHYLRRARHW